VHLIAQDKDDHSNFSIILSFCRHCGEEYAGLVPQKMQQLATKYGVEVPKSEFLSADKQLNLRTMLKGYFKALCKHVLAEQAELMNMTKNIRRTMECKGEISTEKRIHLLGPAALVVVHPVLIEGHVLRLHDGQGHLATQLGGPHRGIAHDVLQPLAATGMHADHQLIAILEPALPSKATPLAGVDELVLVHGGMFQGVQQVQRTKLPSAKILTAKPRISGIKCSSVRPPSVSTIYFFRLLSFSNCFFLYFLVVYDVCLTMFKNTTNMLTTVCFPL